MLLSRSLLSLAACALGVAKEASKAKRPNILFILTDDQDLHMEGVDYMPHLKADIVDKGVSYNRHYCTTALCCPSRLSLWTGKLSHNHNVTTVRPPLGGYPKIVKEGFNDDYLPIWMQNAGYNTYYTGKLWNFHDVDNYNDPHAKGYNSSDFLLDPFTYRYWDAKISHNGEPPESFAGQYSTDVIAQKSRDLLEEALGHDEPWFLTVAPIAPHSNWVYDLTNNNSFVSAPPAAPRHEHMFLDYKIPRGGNFNKPIHGGGGWPGELTPLNDTVITYNDFWQRSRLQSLLAVDDLVHGLMEDLEKSGELDNTYVFYTTDNGYHLSQHAMVGGKMCGLDTDIHIPMYVRGPGMKAGGEIDVVTTHTDVASTLLRIAGIERDGLDGQQMPFSQCEAQAGRSEHTAIEFWGRAIPEGHYGFRSDASGESGDVQGAFTTNTYKGLRMVGEDYGLYYQVWCDGDHDFFDTKGDPDQNYNLLSDLAKDQATEYTLAGRPLETVVTRLDALIMVLKDCKGQLCTEPWRALHLEGDITTLKEALDEKYDDFYDKQPKMSFDECLAGYMLDNESTEHVTPYSQNDNKRSYGDNWLLAV